MKNCRITSLGIWIKEGTTSEYLSIQVKVNLDGLLITKNYLANFDVEGQQEVAYNYPKKLGDEYGITDDQILIFPKNSNKFLVDNRLIPEWVCKLKFTYQQEVYSLTCLAKKNERTKEIQPHFKMFEYSGIKPSLLNKFYEGDLYKDDEILSSELQDSLRDSKQDDYGDDVPTQEYDTM